jgi:hypothetical protein
VEHGEETDRSTEQSRIGRGVEQCLGSGAEQDLVNLSRILKCQASDLRRQSEDDVEIRYGQKLGFALREPARASLGLALGAVAVPARVI